MSSARAKVSPFCRLTVPTHFAGPPPHVHHGFDEAIHVLSGTLTLSKNRHDSEIVL